MPAPSGGGASFGVTRMETMPAPAPALSFAALASTVCFAFLGGLLLNLMPCVFPVLFLKGLALVQSGNEERHKLRAHGFVYTAGILVSFWALVGHCSACAPRERRWAGDSSFSRRFFCCLMAGLLFFLGLSLAGQFEIGLTLTSAAGWFAGPQNRATQAAFSRECWRWSSPRRVPRLSWERPSATRSPSLPPSPSPSLPRLLSAWLRLMSRSPCSLRGRACCPNPACGWTF